MLTIVFVCSDGTKRTITLTPVARRRSVLRVAYVRAYAPVQTLFRTRTATWANTPPK